MKFLLTTAVLLVSTSAIHIRHGASAEVSATAAEKVTLHAPEPAPAFKQTRPLPKEGDCAATGGIEVEIKSIINPPAMDWSLFGSGSSDVAAAFRCGRKDKGSVAQAQTEVLPNVKPTATGVFKAGKFCFPGQAYEAGVLASEGCRIDVWDDDSSFLNLKSMAKKLFFSDSHWSGHDHIGGFDVVKACDEEHQVGKDAPTSKLKFSVKEVLSPGTKQRRADDAKKAADKIEAEKKAKIAAAAKAEGERLAAAAAAEKDAAKKKKLQDEAAAAKTAADKKQEESNKWFELQLKIAQDQLAKNQAEEKTKADEKAKAEKLAAEMAAAEAKEAAKQKKEDEAEKKAAEEQTKTDAKLSAADKKKCCLQIGFKKGYFSSKCRARTASEVDVACCADAVTTKGSPEHTTCQKSAEGAKKKGQTLVQQMAAKIDAGKLGTDDTKTIAKDLGTGVTDGAGSSAAAPAVKAAAVPAVKAAAPATTAAPAAKKPTNSQFKKCDTDEHCGAFCAPWPAQGGTPKNGCQPSDATKEVTSGANQNNNQFKYCAKKCTADKCGKKA